MKYHVGQFFKKICAVFLSFLMTISTAIFGKEIEPPVETEGNFITEYSKENADYFLVVDAEDEIHDISDLLFGIFFEDINFAADGGLYAEMVVNRSFEFTDLAKDDEFYGWSVAGETNAEVIIDDTENCLNENNTNYLVLNNNSQTLAGVKNVGFLDGMAIEEDAKYNFSVYAKSTTESDSLTVRLCVGDKVVAQAETAMLNSIWTKYDLELTSTTTASQNVTLQVLTEGEEVHLDMISLFPEDTYKGRKNGLRKDLSLLLEELEPKFLRFPGGCVIEGYTKETSYVWKDSLAVGKDGLPLAFDGTYGNVAARNQGENIWTDHSATDDPWPCFMTYGLGFYEYFLLAEDLGAIGVPVINCGLFCQMRGCGPVDMATDEFRQYVQDMHDLIEFCRGNENSTWGKVRVSLGHEEPFELKYICIGNENEGEVYFERYQAFLDSFNTEKEKNPELYEGIELIYSAGASDGSHSGNYIKSYEYAKTQVGENGNINDFAGAIDQHYYNEPQWFFKNTDYYDEENYKRNVNEMTDTPYGGAIQVFLGEYAARSNKLEAALAEAAYMTGLERNGDIVRMASYAPLFGNNTACHWAPDLIWFANTRALGSINYYVQKLFSINAGTKLLSSTFEGAGIPQEDLKGRVGVGTWYTEAEFDNVKIVDNNTGKTLGSDKFAIPNFWWNWDNVNNGNFKIKNGKLVHEGAWMQYCETGDIAYFGNENWSNYTFTIDATKTDGDEGFLVAVAVGDKHNNFFWNIGGWNNTTSCLQEIENGIKTGKIAGTTKPFEVETGKTYKLKVVVDGTKIQCYIDGELYIDYDNAATAEAETYHVVSKDDNGDIIIKFVNRTGRAQTTAIDLGNANISSTAEINQVKGDRLDNENHLWLEEDCIMEEFTLDGVSNKFNYTLPAYSVTSIRLKTA